MTKNQKPNLRAFWKKYEIAFMLLGLIFLSILTCRVIVLMAQVSPIH